MRFRRLIGAYELFHNINPAYRWNLILNYAIQSLKKINLVDWDVFFFSNVTKIHFQVFIIENWKLQFLYFLNPYNNPYPY